MQPVFVSTAQIAATLTPTHRSRHGVITITGIGDHLRPEWPITITGMRSDHEQVGICHARCDLVARISWAGGLGRVA
jgi:hypothetical protein